MSLGYVILTEGERILNIGGCKLIHHLLSSCSVLGTALNIEDLVVNRTNSLLSLSLHSSVEDKQGTKISL